MKNIDLNILNHADDKPNVKLFSDKAYEGYKIRISITDNGVESVIPPKSNRKEPWNYAREIYKKRNEIERLSRRIKRTRKVFT